MNILAIGPHPDDIEFYCSGTMAKYAARGDSVYFAVATDGGRGSTMLPREQLVEVRHSEAQAAASVIGAELIWMGLPDAALFHNEDNRLKFISAVRQARADIIICSSPDDYHPDHVNSGKLAMDAALMSTIPLIETAYPPLEKSPYVFWMEHPSGIGFTPTEYVDITDVFEMKKKMLACHKSQVEWIGDQYGGSMIDDMEVVARFRGLQCGVRYGEGFIPVQRYPGAYPGRLLP